MPFGAAHTCIAYVREYPPGIKVTLLQLLTSWPLSRYYWLYECHPIVCLHDIDSALEMTASDFSASRQPPELLKLIKYFTILCLTNWNVKLKNKKRLLDESSETSSVWNVSSACWQIHLRRIQADGQVLTLEGVSAQMRLSRAFKTLEYFFYLLVGKVFKFNGKLPRFKLLLEFYRRSWSWLT